MRWWSLVLVMGCQSGEVSAPSREVISGPAVQAEDPLPKPPPGVYTLTTTPLVGGKTAQLVVTDVPPGARVNLVFSSNTSLGSTCPAPLRPVCLDLRSPVSILRTATADGSGRATFLLPIPDPIPLDGMALQAATTSPGEPATSNALVEILHEPASDLDGDDLTAADEFDRGTDPLLPDSDGGGLDDGLEVASGLDPLDPSDDLPRITYTDDIEPLLASRCYSCHGGGAASGGRNFDTYEELFQRSADVPSIELIRPFDVNASYLRHKVRGTQATVGGAGSRMPLGGPFLTEPQLLLIEDWINLGAPR